MFACAQHLDGLGSVQPVLSDQSHSVDALVRAHGIERGIGIGDLKFARSSGQLLCIQVAQGDLLHVRMELEKRNEATPP